MTHEFILLAVLVELRVLHEVLARDVLVKHSDHHWGQAGKEHVVRTQGPVVKHDLTRKSIVKGKLFWENDDQQTK